MGIIMNKGIIIQARTSSTRLPGKVLKPLPYGDKATVLQQVIRRCKAAGDIRVIVATTKAHEDDEIVKLSKMEGVDVFRGSKNDVLSRYYNAAKKYNLDVIVRVTSDCPCLDPQIIRKLIKKLTAVGADYVSNTLKRTYPHGLDAEVFTFSTLEKAHKYAHDMSLREHVTMYIYKNARKFKIANIESPARLNRPDIRITLDTEDDYILLCLLYEFLYRNNPIFSPNDIIKIFTKYPYLLSINRRIIQKKVFKNVKDEVKEAIRVLNLQDLKRASKLLKEI